MKSKVSQVLNNKFLKFLFGFIKIVIWIFVILVIGMILIQKIFNNDVSIGSLRMFTIVSGSMEPEYKIFDVIVAKETEPSQIKVGDDVVYLGKEADFADKIVTHRVIDVNQKEGKYYFETQGIANDSPDPIISSDQVYGTVVYKPVVLSFLSHILNTTTGFYFLVFVPIAFLVFLEILDYVKKREELCEREEKQIKNN